MFWAKRVRDRLLVDDIHLLKDGLVNDFVRRPGPFPVQKKQNKKKTGQKHKACRLITICISVDISFIGDFADHGVHYILHNHTRGKFSCDILLDIRTV